MDGFMPGGECRECKGRCCKEKGCSLSPEDLHWSPEKTDRKTILALLDKPDGLYAIDCFFSQTGGVYYLRMRHKCYTFIGVDAIGECVALTKEGCSFSDKDRPKGGRFLKSSPDFHCRQEYTEEMMRRDWEPYQEVLASVWEEYEEKFQKDGTFDACDKAYFDWLRGHKKSRCAVASGEKRQ